MGLAAITVQTHSRCGGSIYMRLRLSYLGLPPEQNLER